MRYFIIVICVFIQIATFGQSLSVEETINYIRSIYKNNSLPQYGGFKFIDLDIVISSDGFVRIEEHMERPSEYGPDSRFYSHIREFHYTDIKKIDLYSNHVTFWCESGECVHDGNSTRVFINSGIKVNLHPRYLAKVKNGFIYLFDLIRIDPKYNQKDDDPFSPWNFKKDVLTNLNIKSEAIPLVRVNGVLQISVKLGEVPVTMILDSGASDVSISSDVELALIERGIIDKNNYVSSALYKIANGEIVESRRFIIPSITVSNFTVKNVICSVSPSGDVMLLGNSFLSKFTSWKIHTENNTLELTK